MKGFFNICLIFILYSTVVGGLYAQTKCEPESDVAGIDHGRDFNLNNRINDKNFRKTFIRKYQLAEVQFEKCKKHLVKKNYKKAEAGLLKTLEIMPHHANSHFHYARLLYDKGDFKKALTHIVQAENDYILLLSVLEQVKTDNEGQLKKEKLFLTLRLNELKGSYTKQNCKRVIPDLINSMEGKLDNIDKKSGAKFSASKVPPAEFYYIHGNILFKMKKYPDAYKQYRQTIAIDPAFCNAYVNLANLDYMIKRYDKALHYLDQAETHGGTVDPRFKDTLQKCLANSGTAPGNSPSQTGNRIKVKTFRVIVGEIPDTFDENTYIVYDLSSRDALLIDPGAQDPRIETFIKTEGLKIKKILNTHGHHDHIEANGFYAGRFGVDVIAHEGDQLYYSHSDAKNTPTEFFKTEGTFQYGTLKFNLLHTPGHSPGSVCFYFPESSMLIAGDTLFRKSIGVVPGRTPEKKQGNTRIEVSSIKKKLLVLPSDTNVFPGHGAATTIGDEIKGNPFLNKNTETK